MPEDGVLVLPGVPGRLPGLHRPLPLLQVPPGLRHLGALPPRSQKALPVTKSWAANGYYLIITRLHNPLEYVLYPSN